MAIWAFIATKCIIVIKCAVLCREALWLFRKRQVLYTVSWNGLGYSLENHYFLV